VEIPIQFNLPRAKNPIISVRQIMASIPLIRSLSQRKRRAVFWVAGVLAFYTLFGFFILPLIARSVLTSQLSKQLGREVSIARVKSNPFELSASVHGLLIKDRDGGPFVSWDEVYANFQLSTLFSRNWYFKEVRVRNPYARIQVNPDRKLNFADILDRLAKTADAVKPVQPTKPLGRRLDQPASRVYFHLQ
jgi:hypothetical protein